MTKAKEAEVDVIETINIVDLCNNLHVLPQHGGLFEQDSLFVHLYQYVMQLKNTREELDQRQEQANSRIPNRRRH